MSAHKREVIPAPRRFKAAEWLAAVGVLGVVLSLFVVPDGYEDLGVEVTLGLALMISAFLARDNVSTVRKHHAAVQLSDAAGHLTTDDASSNIAAVYLLSSLCVDVRMNPSVRSGAYATLETAGMGDRDPVVTDAIAVQMAKIRQTMDARRSWWERLLYHP